jgi:hypothetical protein
MKIVVTGSIAYDYLMSFPGKFTEHFAGTHEPRQPELSSTRWIAARRLREHRLHLALLGAARC